MSRKLIRRLSSIAAHGSHQGNEHKDQWAAQRACPRDVPEPPSTVNGHHQQQPMNLKLARDSDPRATHGNTLVMRSSRRLDVVARARDIRGMILLGELAWTATTQVAVAANHEPRMLLKTLRDGARAGLSSGLIRRGSRASAGDRTRPQLQVTDHTDLPRTHAYRLGKRVGGIPPQGAALDSPRLVLQSRFSAVWRRCRSA